MNKPLEPKSTSQPPLATTENGVVVRTTTLDDGPALFQMARDAKGLDLNSSYSYALMGWMFGDTCLIAEDDSGPLGFVVGFRPPLRPSSIFVWQIGVLPEARGRGVATTLLEAFLEHDPPPKMLEATVTPSNRASRRMFAALARKRGAEMVERPLMSARVLAGEHEPEHLIEIGPLHH